MSESEMKINPARAAELVSQLQEVQQRIVVVAKGRPVRERKLLLYRRVNRK